MFYSLESIQPGVLLNLAKQRVRDRGMLPDAKPESVIEAFEFALADYRFSTVLVNVSKEIGSAMMPVYTRRGTRLLPEIYSLYAEDLTKCEIYGCIAAWLTPAGDMWRLESEFPGIGEASRNLSYGAAYNTQNLKPFLCAANDCLVHPPSADLDSSEELLDLLVAEVTRSVQDYFPAVTEDIIRELYIAYKDR